MKETVQNIPENLLFNALVNLSSINIEIARRDDRIILIAREPVDALWARFT